MLLLFESSFVSVALAEEGRKDSPLSPSIVIVNGKIRRKKKVIFLVRLLFVDFAVNAYKGVRNSTRIPCIFKLSFRALKDNFYEIINR